MFKFHHLQIQFTQSSQLHFRYLGSDILFHVLPVKAINQNMLPDFLYLQLEQKNYLSEMIECSPQEAIAQSLYNCYYRSQFLVNSDSSNSKFKNMKGKTPVKKMEKISLKKSPSLEKPFNQQDVRHPQSSLQKVTIDSNPYMLGKTSNSNIPIRIIENKSTANVRLVNKQVQMVYLLPKNSNQFHCQAYKEYSVRTNTVSQGVKMEPDKISRAETYHSTARSQNRQNSNFYSFNVDEVKVQQNCQKAVQMNAERKSLNSSQLPLEMLNPKVAESVVDQSLREQDEFSEVISSYFTKKVKNKDQQESNSKIIY